MPRYNRVILIGHLTRDVELKHTDSGTAVTEVGLAVNDRRKSQSGEWVEETTFFDVTLWARTAEVAKEYLSKGSPVLIEGRLKLDTWETDDQKRSKLRVVGERLQMLGSRSRRDESEHSNFVQRKTRWPTTPTVKIATHSPAEGRGRSAWASQIAFI